MTNEIKTRPVRLPLDLHASVKMEAAKKGVSIQALLREKLQEGKKEEAK